MDLSEVEQFIPPGKGSMKYDAPRESLFMARLLEEAARRGNKQCFGAWNSAFGGMCALAAACSVINGKAHNNLEAGTTYFSLYLCRLVLHLNDAHRLTFREIASELRLRAAREEEAGMGSA
jgi:hypothetical protein